MQSIEPNESIINCQTDRLSREDYECTFQPKTARNIETHPISPHVGLRRTQLLYQLARVKSKEKKDRRHD
jgi:hypothetical protein